MSDKRKKVHFQSFGPVRGHVGHTAACARALNVCCVCHVAKEKCRRSKRQRRSSKCNGVKCFRRCEVSAHPSDQPLAGAFAAIQGALSRIPQLRAHHFARVWHDGTGHHGGLVAPDCPSVRPNLWMIGQVDLIGQRKTYDWDLRGSYQKFTEIPFEWRHVPARHLRVGKDCLAATLRRSQVGEGNGVVARLHEVEDRRGLAGRAIYFALIKEQEARLALTVGHVDWAQKAGSKAVEWLHPR